jgi:hypothetical protein
MCMCVTDPYLMLPAVMPRVQCEKEVLAFQQACSRPAAERWVCPRNC